jgi:cobalamin biosynthesis Co2+ chelatase CbiK
MEYFDRKFLLFSEDSAEANAWTVQLTKAGVLESNLEMQNVNIVSKLQDKSFDACIILVGKSLPKLINTVLASIRSNRLASLLPVVVVASDHGYEDIFEYYDNGANYVVRNQKRDQAAKELCHILENLLILLDRYVMGQDKRFLR